MASTMPKKPERKKRVGRPMSASGPIRIMVRCQVSERAQWTAAAEIDGLALSAWIRMQLNRAARAAQ